MRKLICDNNTCKLQKMGPIFGYQSGGGTGLTPAMSPYTIPLGNISKVSNKTQKSSTLQNLKAVSNRKATKSSPQLKRKLLGGGESIVSGLKTTPCARTILVGNCGNPEACDKVKCKIQANEYSSENQTGGGPGLNPFVSPYTLPLKTKFTKPKLKSRSDNSRKKYLIGSGEAKVAENHNSRIVEPTNTDQIGGGKKRKVTRKKKSVLNELPEEKVPCKTQAPFQKWSQLNIFELPPSDVSVETSNWINLTSSTTIRDSYNPIVFSIPASQTQYYDLANSYMYIKARILNKDSTSLAATDIVGPSNLFYYSMVQNMIVSMNGVVVDNDMCQFPYKSIVPLLLTTGNSEESSLLTSALFYRDEEYDENDPTKNAGFKKRLALSKGSKIFDMIGPISSGIFQQGRYIPPGVAIEIRMTRSPPEFCLQSATKSKTGVSGVPYIFTLEECNLVVKANTVRQDILRHHQSLFSKGALAQFPVTHVDTRVSQISVGCSTFLTDLLWSGKLPSYTIFGVLEASAFNGSLEKSPFNFKSNGLSSITLKCDHDSVLYQSINVDYTSDNFQLAYQSLFDCLANKSTGNSISRESFPKGYAFYVFHLLPTAVSGGELQPERRGSMKAEIQFKSPTTTALNCVALGFFQNLIQINGDRNVFLS